MGGYSSKYSETSTINWDKLNTDNMTIGNVANFKLPYEANKLVDTLNLNLPSSIDTEASTTFQTKYTNNVSNNVGNIVGNDYLSSFITSEMYKNLIDTSSNVSDIRNLQKGGNLDEDSSTSSTSTLSDDDLSDSDMLEESEKKQKKYNKPKHNEPKHKYNKQKEESKYNKHKEESEYNKNTEESKYNKQKEEHKYNKHKYNKKEDSDEESKSESDELGDMSYLSSSAHTGGEFSEKSITDEVGYNHVSVNTSDINMISDHKLN